MRQQIVNCIYKGKEYTLDHIETISDVVKGLKQSVESIYYAKIDGEFIDLASLVEKNQFTIELFNSKGEERHLVLWHTSAHIVAQAVRRLYPLAKEAIGPVTSTGFFEDIDFKDHTLHPSELENIEKEVKNIIHANYIIEKREMSRNEALEFFKDNSYKVANLQKIQEESRITVYKQGEYEDLCRGPHLYSTGQVGALLLTNISSAYFMGNKNEKSLQRVSGISFVDDKELRQYEHFIEEAKKRDHRKIGQEMNLFSFQPEGPGFPFWHHKGNTLFMLLMNYMRHQNDIRGYEEIKTPQALNDELWKKSGHYDNFKDNMYFSEIDEKSFALKPMNCPGGCLVFKSGFHSYRELPIRQAEFGLVHRHELSGVLHGLFRVRSFTQDDAHIFCTIDQLEKEVITTIDYILDVYKTCGFKENRIFVATRPDQSIGTDEEWEISTHALTKALEILGIEYSFKEKEGAFYGPKIEFNIKDSLERFWQCGTIQIDFSMPKRFELTYEGSDGNSHTPIMIHRAILGSLERFIGILTEHYAGKFPLWLAPTQVLLLNISQAQLEHTSSLYDMLIKNNVRAEVDLRNETLGYKVRHARNSRVALIGVIGDEEVKNNTISIRNREGKTIVYSPEELIQYIHDYNETQKE